MRSSVQLNKKENYMEDDRTPLQYYIEEARKHYGACVKWALFIGFVGGFAIGMMIWGAE